MNEARATCQKHWFDDAGGTCRECRAAFCDDCLVYTHGPTHPPICLSCALAASGVRAGGGRQRSVLGTSGRVAVGLVTAAAAAAVVPVVSHLH